MSIAVDLDAVSRSVWFLGASPDGGHRMAGTIEAVRLWEGFRSRAELEQDLGRTLSCSDAEVAVWPFYEGQGRAVREVCGEGEAFSWDTALDASSAPEWVRPSALFCPSRCSRCSPPVCTNCSDEWTGTCSACARDSVLHEGQRFTTTCFSGSLILSAASRAPPPLSSRGLLNSSSPSY